MELYHELMPSDIDLAAYTARHSADRLVTYKYVNQEPLYLAFYFPPNYDSNHKYPAFAFIHGGGWDSRNILADQACWCGDYLGYLARYYADKGFICISIDYRLIKDHGQAPSYGIIDSYEDCCDAIEYILESAAKYGIDTEKMYLLGESAGGHLAACVSTIHELRSFSFETVFLINPVTDMNDPKKNDCVPLQSDHILLSSLNLLERAAVLSPLYHVDKQTGKTVLIHGDNDSCVDPIHSKSFYQKMCAANRPCDLHILSKTDHAFLLAEFTDNLDACKTAIQIINSYLPSY